MAYSKPPPDQEISRKMVGSRVGPHQLVKIEVQITKYGYGSMPYAAKENRYACACGKELSLYSATADQRWLEHVLMDVAQKVYNYKPPPCPCSRVYG